MYLPSRILAQALNYSNYRYEKGINSLYSMANMDWRSMIYLDLTARNDWSSTLPPAIVPIFTVRLVEFDDQRDG